MWQKNVRYLDYNATSGVTPFVREKLTEILGSEDELLANPSSRHRLGQKEQHRLHAAGTMIASSLGVEVSPDELIFTSSGTEANQTILHSLAETCDGLIIGSGEHSASYDLLKRFPLSFLHELPLLRSGQYDLTVLTLLLNRAKEMGLKKLGLSVFWANNETGVLTDLALLQETIKNSPVPVVLHLDGAQVWGKIELDVNLSLASYISFSGHKVGAPSGVGVIWARKGVPLNPFIVGAQSRGLRGGTENSLGIRALGFAASKLDPKSFIAHVEPLKLKLEKLLHQIGSPVIIWGEGTTRLSNTTRVSFPEFKTYENWVELLDLKGFAVSHGSACKSWTVEPSRVLLAQGADHAQALNSIRISLGPNNTEEDIVLFVQALSEILNKKKPTLKASPMEASL